MANRRTRYFGHDCLGNTPHAVTIEGVCVADIYRDPQERYYNQTTGERGSVAVGDDGELHFAAAPNPPGYPGPCPDGWLSTTWTEEGEICDWEAKPAA